jgi:hypothetical protein
MANPRTTTNARSAVTDSGRGAILTVSHVGRTMKGYVLAEHELRTVSAFNSLTTGFLSAAFALFSFGVGIVVDACFASKLNEFALVLLKVVCPLVGALSAACFIAAYFSWRQRKTDLAAIIRDSEIREH